MYSLKPYLHFQALKEKTELQAQLATVNAQLQVQVEQTQASQERQSTLTSEVTTLRSKCSTLEKAMVDLQGNLEGKNASLASLGNDLQLAEEQYQRLMVKVEEMQQSLNTRDNTGEEKVVDVHVRVELDQLVYSISVSMCKLYTDIELN